MAKKPTKEASEYDAAAQYDVQLNVPVTIGAFRYLPREKPVMKGALLNKIVEEFGHVAIASANRR